MDGHCAAVMMFRRYILRLLSAGWTLIVTVLSLLPKGQEEGPLLFEGEDTVAHLVMYAGMVLLFYGAAWERRRSATPPVWVPGLLAWGYGALMELAQHVMAWLGRSCSLIDLVANLLGVLAGVLVIRLGQRLWRSRPEDGGRGGWQV